MENVFLLVFDFYNTRKKFSDTEVNDEDYSHNMDIAFSYFEECTSLRRRLFDMFPNKIIELSINSYVVYSELSLEELLSALRQKFIQSHYFGEEYSTRQIYLSEIKGISFLAPRHQRYLVEFVLNLSKNRKQKD